MLERLRAHHSAGGAVASVCAGAEAGWCWAAGRAQVHHAPPPPGRAGGPPPPGDRGAGRAPFTTDDRVVTSAGIASGIDLALHLLAVRHGPALAAQVARDMVVYARRNGHERPQASAMLRHRSHLDDAVHRAQDLIDARFAEPLPLAYVAASVGVSERTLTRMFHRATGGLTLAALPADPEWNARSTWIGHGATVEAAAREVGFQDVRMLRRLRSQRLPRRRASRSAWHGRSRPRT